MPQTMETPTPVSALMHAGIVNAGGYLIVRTSPIVSSTPWALAVLASVGAVTACYAALVMLTQSSVKKSLAYSTIAQMGFMMLQCGLGAFSAALLHILAHSMYKAHAFLSSGSLVVEPSASLTAAAKPAQAGGATASVFGRSMFGLAAAACSFGALTLAMIAVGTDPSTKPGGLILGAVLCLALTHWLINVFAAADRTLAIRGVAVVAGLCFAYAAAYRVVDLIAGTSVPSGALPIVQWSAVVLIVVIGFGSLFWFERSSARGTAATAGGRWFVHASNGFYVESTLRRVFGPLWSC